MKSFLHRIIPTKNIHLDFASTTPVDSKVLKAMTPYFSEAFYNPSSSYAQAQEVKKDIKKFRTNISTFFQCKPNEVIFTQGGTESNNLAVLGLARHALNTCEFVPHMIFSAIEHPAITECYPALKKMGIEIDIVPVSAKGIVDVQLLEKTINERTVLISVILVSNEIGTIQPLHKIASIVKKFKNRAGRSFSHYPYIHTDASQAILTQESFVSKLGADMISVDGSKIYAPKMSGLLIKKHFVHLEPLMYGGGQESGLRSGTENPATIAGISTALDLIGKNRDRDTEKFEKLKSLMIEELTKSGLPYEINGTTKDALPNILNICITGLNSDFAVIQLDELGVNCSSMTACASTKGLPESEVVRALGKPGCAASSLRFSFGRHTTVQEIRKTVSILSTVCQKQKVV